MSTSSLATSSLSERIRYWFRPPRKLRFTRQGRWFVGITLLVGFGAINTGNNLLYMLLGMMLGLIIVSGVMSETMLRKVRVLRLPGEPIFAGRQATVQYRLHNDKRLFPSFSIEVTEEASGSKEAVDGAKMRRKSRTKAKKQRDLAIPRGLVHRIGAGRQRVGTGQILIAKRGLYKYDTIELATRFPFGFFRKSRNLDRFAERLVFPRLVPPPRVVEGAFQPEGHHDRQQKGIGQEYFGLRDYQHGEDWRRIHWKVSARRGELIIRENQRELSRTLTIAIHHALPPESKAVAHEAAERAIEVAAALARKYLSEGYTVGLATLDGAVRPGLGTAQLTLILSALAVLEVHGDGATRSFLGVPGGVPVFLVQPQHTTVATHTPRNTTVIVVDEVGEAELQS